MASSFCALFIKSSYFDVVEDLLKMFELHKLSLLNDIYIVNISGESTIATIEEINESLMKNKYVCIEKYLSFNSKVFITINYRVNYFKIEYDFFSAEEPDRFKVENLVCRKFVDLIPSGYSIGLVVDIQGYTYTDDYNWDDIIINHQNYIWNEGLRVVVRPKLTSVITQLNNVEDFEIVGYINVT